MLKLDGMKNSSVFVAVYILYVYICFTSDNPVHEILDLPQIEESTIFDIIFRLSFKFFLKIDFYDYTDRLVSSLENVMSHAFKRFTDNEINMKRNARKCYLLISSSEKVHGNIVTLQIKNSSCKKLLGVDIYCKQSFENLII